MRGHEMILIADDRDEERRLIGVVLRRLGYSVIEEHSGFEAVEGTPTYTDRGYRCRWWQSQALSMGSFEIGACPWGTSSSSKATLNGKASGDGPANTAIGLGRGRTRESLNGPLISSSHPSFRPGCQKKRPGG